MYSMNKYIKKYSFCEIASKVRDSSPFRRNYHNFEEF